MRFEDKQHGRPAGRLAAALSPLALLPCLCPASPASPFQGPSAALTREIGPGPDASIWQGPPVQTGEIIVTEFMKDPATVTDARGEWIEVYNTLPWRANLEGLFLADDAGALHIIHVGGAGLRFGPGKYLVLGNNSDPALNGGVQVDYVWSGFSLGNGADQIVLKRVDGTVVDRVAYDDGVLWPDTPGRSISLRMDARTAYQNDDPANWCHSSVAISATNGDTGTPRGDNDACP